MCPGFWKSHFYLLDRCKLNETIIDNEKIWHSQFYSLVIWCKTVESQIKYSHKIRNSWYLTWYMACNPKSNHPNPESATTDKEKKNNTNAVDVQFKLYLTGDNK